MSTSFPPPPPIAAADGGAFTVPPFMPEFPPPYSPPPPSSSPASSVFIILIVISSAVFLTAAIYIVLRRLSRRFHRTAPDDVVLPPPDHPCAAAPSAPPLDSLPLFTFRSVTGTLTGGDCAVCLSKFEPHDQLRLLPLCCHAFHAACIDAWIVSSQTCPLCRSTVLPSDADVLDKLSSNARSGSFRIEIGSISRRGSGAASADRRTTYSVGSFDYIVDDGSGYEVPVGSTVDRRGISELDKESWAGIPAAPGEAVAAEVSSGRSNNWLKEYVDRLGLSSRAMSFRSSGRWFAGSSRRTEAAAAAAAAEDLEANRVGEEISELFRWLSGV